jgi:hypothetical protein
MEEHSSGGGAKDLLSLLKRKPALLIAGIAGVVLLFLILRAKGGSSTTTAPAGTSGTNTGQGSANLGTVTIQTQSSGLAPVYSGVVPQHLLPTTNATSATTPSSAPTPTVPTQPTTGTANPQPSQNSTPSTNTSSASPPPFTGILGPGYNFASAQKALGTLPAGDKLISGGQDRVWEVNPQGVQTLVTSGYGPAVTNSGYKNGQGPSTPGAKAG